MAVGPIAVPARFGETLGFGLSCSLEERNKQKYQLKLSVVIKVFVHFLIGTHCVKKKKN
jgi:hypothetical protein